jgi:hypothetical protein
MEILLAIDALDDLVAQARPVPLTDDVRVDPQELSGRAARIRETMPRELAGRPAIPELIDRLDAVVAGAKPVPLTRQVRVRTQSVYDLLDELRATLPEELAAVREGTADVAMPPAQPVPLDDASRELRTLVERVRFGGERFVIESGGVPMARLEPPD